MKLLRSLSLLLLLAFSLPAGGLLRAQAQTEEVPPPVAPAAPAKPSAVADPALPAVPTSTAVTESSPTKQSAEEGEEPESTENPLRELTGTDSEAVAVATNPDGENPSGKRSSRRNRSGNSERIAFVSNSTLGADEHADVVVSIFGSSTSAGTVADSVVSVIGSSRVTDGSVGDSVVSVLGNTYINGEVRGQVVTVLGNVELGPKAVVHGEVVCIGGQITRDAQAVTKGGIQNVALAGRHFDFTALTTWFSECLVYIRPLAFHRNLVWAWCIALSFLAVYALIALITPAGVLKCVETLEQRPGTSLLAALLTLLLTPVAYILLMVTLVVAVGVVLIPLFSLGLFFAAIFGKIVMLAWLGRRVTRLMGDGPLAHPVFGVLIGGVIVLGLYTIPVVGFLTYKLLGILGLGVVVYTLILQFKASRPVKAAVGPTPNVAVMAEGTAGAGYQATETPSLVAPLVSAAPPVISAATLPRVGFWLRLGASVLDCIMIGIVLGMSSKVFHGWLTPGGSLPFWFAVYSIAMWATKGTTIGGIICGIRVVRLDDRPIDWGVAIVRALGAFLSLAVAGIGFIWVAFDDDKQSWHDKIAGTTIVKVPKGTPLL